MLYRVFSVYDNAARFYNLPFYFLHVGEATRAFADLANDLSTNVGRHPSDFTLYEVGSFDAITGQVLAHHPFVSHGVATSFVRPKAAELPLMTASTPPTPAMPEATPAPANGRYGPGFPGDHYSVE